jgi:hypothetical protein
MADGRRLRARKALVEWLRKPESWLSVAALVISGLTFYFLYAKPGDLQIFIADEVGLRLQGDSTLFLVLPVTMVNTGAAKKARVVQGISSIMTKQPAGADNISYAARWRVEYTFLGKDQYLQKYPTKASEAVDPRIADFLDYNGRAVPFTIPGGSSTSKVLGLQQEGGRFAGTLREFTIRLRVRAGPETFESEAQFDCGGRTIEAAVTNYCRRKT